MARRKLVGGNPGCRGDRTVQLVVSVDGSATTYSARDDMTVQEVAAELARGSRTGRYAAGCRMFDSGWMELSAHAQVGSVAVRQGERWWLFPIPSEVR